MNPEIHELLRMGLAILCGGVLGIEREYMNKSAGFRTIILICLGSAIFTQVSMHWGSDRIASTVVTGIGFIGAGVIFKDNQWVKGLTTSAVIWISAAIGMLIGSGHSLMAVLATILTLLVLSFLPYVEDFMDRIHHRKQFIIVFAGETPDVIEWEESVIQRQLRLKRIRLAKTESGTMLVANVIGNKKKIRQLNEDMIGMKHIRSFTMS